MNKQQRIVALVRQESDRANAAYRQACIEHAAAIVSANMWDQFNPDDGVGGFGRNPYNIDAASERERVARIYCEQMREAYDFAVDTFIEARAVAARGAGEREGGE